MIALQPATTSVRVRVCALQLYQDNLLDLLPLDGVTGRPGTVMARPSLRIACASTSSTQPTVVGLKKHDVRNLAEVMALYKHAIAARSVAETCVPRVRTLSARTLLPRLSLAAHGLAPRHLAAPGCSTLPQAAPHCM